MDEHYSGVFINPGFFKYHSPAVKPGILLIEFFCFSKKYVIKIFQMFVFKFSPPSPKCSGNAW
jgi:hypothetical protein